MSQIEASRSRAALPKETKIQQRRQDNYILANRFYIEMQSGIITASFSECSGFGIDVKKETYLEGGVNQQQRVFLGHAEFPDITLKHGMTDDLTFWNWVQEILQPGRKNRRNVNILMFNQAGEIMQRWTLIGAVPVSWRSPGFQADSNTVAIEEMTLAYEGLKVVTRPHGSGGVTVGSRDSLGFFPDY
jgi:phage tail-like protein